MKNPIGNEDAMTMVKDLIQQSEQIRLAGDLKEGVNIDYMSTEGNHYIGVIVFKRPTMKDLLKMGGLKSEYLRLGGAVDIDLVDSSVKAMAQIMATLATVIIKCPAWFMELEDIKEVDLLYHVYDKWEEWDNSFRKPNTEESSEDSGTAE